MLLIYFFLFYEIDNLFSLNIVFSKRKYLKYCIFRKFMNSKPKQISFLEFLIDENASPDDSLGEVIFPKGFEVRDLENLRKEFEILANRYGLSLPAKLKKGNLVLEWKPLPGEIQNNTEKKFGKVKLKPKVSNLTTEELIAFSESFVNIQKN